MAVNGIALLAPLFLGFEIWQLVMCERYVGIKQIARGAEPREMGPSEPVAFLWSACIVLYAVWMIALLATPHARFFGFVLVAATAVGYSLRRNCDLRRILVILTFEGAVRIAVLTPLAVIAWSRL
jgi:hypothetical protein